MTEPAIIEVALNGALPKRANPRVPRSPTEVAEDAVTCIAAGASILHNHTDDGYYHGHYHSDFLEAAKDFASRAVLNYGSCEEETTS